MVYLPMPIVKEKTQLIKIIYYDCNCTYLTIERVEKTIKRELTKSELLYLGFIHGANNQQLEDEKLIDNLFNANRLN